jgi:hypothetical protein
MKLSSVLTDITGASGQTILAALIAGERDASRPADLAHGRARNNIPAPIEALGGESTAHHAFMCARHLAEIDHFTARIAEFERGVAEPTGAREHDLGNHETIPGAIRTAGQITPAETGGDMTRSAAGHLASRIGIRPGAHESAGVRRSGRTRPGNSTLERLLGITAMVAVESKESCLGVFHRRIAARRGQQRARRRDAQARHRHSGTPSRTRPPTATSAPTTSPAATPNVPCDARSRRPAAPARPSASNP